ncbi:MAG: S8 family peptidase [Calditrichaeota bacterium]|nr:S8 family peptidase [Calditrichota bacterium]MCB9366758.1 S8 family peptidase [Calditrichota bacterium]MCB9391911.1 S8 family peptidase [Calditrichota bacterium]
MFRYSTTLFLLLAFASIASADSGRYWVFFTDKAVAPGQESRAFMEARANYSPRALERRARNGVFELSIGDLPVSASYVRQVAQTGARIRVTSRWLNSVSVEATPEQLRQIEVLRFVRETRRFSRSVSIEQPTRVEHAAVDTAEYGPSFAQNALCGVPELHARGLSGNGVLLCMLDTGFRTEHESLNGLNYLAMFDFINGDTIVHNEEGQDSFDQHSHGTAVLSAAAGLDSNNIIGPAFGATWMLAKTEYVPTETEVEEDYYVAGMEWADSAGADITSSSLGYIDWYTQDQMDGHTTVVAQAVTEAQRRGILVVTAQGNERGSEWNYIISPADADSILAVGGVDSMGVLWGGSSPGPTADGRTKPDICAQSSQTYCASAFGLDSYWRLSGTSLATPIIAGIAACVLEANPEWTAQQVREALKMTASNALTPDNDLGWGIANGPAAADYVFTSAAERPALPGSISMAVFPNPVNGFATLSLTLETPDKGAVVLYDLLGRQVLQLNSIDSHAGTTVLSFAVDQLASGKYFVQFAGSRQRVTAPLIILK